VELKFCIGLVELSKWLSEGLVELSEGLVELSKGLVELSEGFVIIELRLNKGASWGFNKFGIKDIVFVNGFSTAFWKRSLGTKHDLLNFFLALGRGSLKGLIIAWIPCNLSDSSILWIIDSFLYSPFR